MAAVGKMDVEINPTLETVVGNINCYSSKLFLFYSTPIFVKATAEPKRSTRSRVPKGKASVYYLFN